LDSNKTEYIAKDIFCNCFICIHEELKVDNPFSSMVCWTPFLRHYEPTFLVQIRGWG